MRPFRRRRVFRRQKTHPTSSPYFSPTPLEMPDEKAKTNTIYNFVAFFLALRMGMRWRVVGGYGKIKEQQSCPK
jgi:hypothetical protein